MKLSSLRILDGKQNKLERALFRVSYTYTFTSYSLPLSILGVRSVASACSQSKFASSVSI